MGLDWVCIIAARLITRGNHNAPTLSPAVPKSDDLQLAKAIGTYLDAHALGGVPQNSSQGLPKQNGRAKQLTMPLVLNTNGLGDLEVPPFVATFPYFSSTFSLGRIVPTAQPSGNFMCSRRQVYSLQNFSIWRPSDLFALVRRRHRQYCQLQTQHWPEDTVIAKHSWALTYFHLCAGILGVLYTSYVRKNM